MQSIRIAYVVVAFVLALLCLDAAAKGKKTLLGDIEGEMPGAPDKTYKMYVPPTYAKRKKHALLVYLHPYNAEPTIREPWKELAKERRVIILAPHCAEEAWFGRSDNPNIVALLDMVFENYKIDERGVYLLGVSQGALQAFYFLDEHPELFRAAATFIMSCPYDVTLPAGFPLYLAAGVRDTIIPIENVRKSVNRLKEGGVKVDYMEHPDRGHNVPVKIEEVWQWYQKVAPRKWKH